MTAWFGLPWNPHCCTPEEHVATPVGEPCDMCDLPIVASDQGVRMPLVESMHPPVWRTITYHLDCWLKHIGPHGPDCEYCRGLQRHQHAGDCSNRLVGERCDCEPGKRAAQKAAQKGKS